MLYLKWISNGWFYPYSAGSLHWHSANCMRVPVPVKRSSQWSIHYSDVIMVSIHQPRDCLLVCSDADQRKHHSSTSHAFVRGNHRGQVNSSHKWLVTRKSVFIWWRHHEMHHRSTQPVIITPTKQNPITTRCAYFMGHIIHRLLHVSSAPNHYLRGCLGYIHCSHIIYVSIILSINIVDRCHGVIGRIRWYSLCIVDAAFQEFLFRQ